MNDGHSAAWDQEWDKAVSAYRRALQEFPDHPKALNSLGLALYQLNNIEEALQIYVNVAKVSPDDPAPMEKVAQISERLGELKKAVEASMLAGDLFFKQRDTDKALENWVRVTNLNPEHALAHSRLAQVHEKLGHAPQAVTEYLAIASILQRAGNLDKAKEMVGKAQSLLPNSTEVKQAITSLNTGQLLPKPMRGKGGTGPIRMAQVKQLQQPAATQSAGLDPIALIRLKDFIRQERQRGKTIIVTTHIISLVEELADEIVFLLEGNIYFRGTAQQLREQNKEVDLEHAIAAILGGEKKSGMTKASLPSGIPYLNGHTVLPAVEQEDAADL